MIATKSLLHYAVLLLVLGAQYAPRARTIIVPIDFPTIQKGINEAEEGDTVHVRNGVYHEIITLQDDIVVTGQAPDKTVISGDGRSPVVRAANNSVLMNFTLRNGGDGVLSENTNLLIQNNIISQNKKTGIRCLVSLPHIRNNIIADNEWSGIFCELVSYGMRTCIEHNILADNGYSGVYLSRKSGVLVKNNVFYRNRQYAIFVSQDSKRSRIIHNNFWGNRRLYNTFAVVDETNTDKDPMFPAMAWASFDFLARYDSPLARMGKDGATMGIVTSRDLENTRRDTDGDGIYDDKDNCSDMAEDFDEFEDDDGCPDFDNDFDGIYDTQDECPDDPEDFDGFADYDGCPDLDNDEDGIPDSIDKCPNRAEVVNGYKDEDGCPDRKPQ